MDAANPGIELVYDYKKYAILYVDDEEKSLKLFRMAYGERFRILTAANALEGLKLLEAQPDEIGLLMTDQRMPGQGGVWLLEKARQLRPRMIRILVTAYADMDAAIAAVNDGAIYKYITKPWDPPQLQNTLQRGLEFFMVQRERDQLLREKLSVLRHMMVSDRLMSLGFLAAGLSHHIRNSLVAVKTFLDLAPLKMAEEKADMKQVRNPEFWKDYYQSAQSQVERINTLLHDLWSASEPAESAGLQPVALRQLVATVVESQRRALEEAQLQVSNQIPDSLPSLMVEPARFQRLFELLVADELVNLPPGGRLEFSAQLLAAPAAGQPAEIELRLSDNGPGLPQEALRVLFDPLAVRGNTPLEYGINLMACYFLVHHHGGRIQALSPAGGGTTFVLRLPLRPVEQEPAPQEAEFFSKVVSTEALLEQLLGGKER